MSADAFLAAARRKRAAVTDTWQRLKPWARYTSAAALVLAAGGLLAGSLGLFSATGLQVVSTPVSIKVPALPAAPEMPIATPAETAAAPTVNNTDALRTLLGTKIELKPAPFPELIIARNDGMLPRIADDGTEPWRAYARPQAPPPAGAARLAFVMLEAGLSERQTGQALEQLPGQVTFAYDAYTPELADQINQARAKGHEVLLDVPMEPETYPLEDPGPETLMTQISARENLQGLRTFMSKAPGALAIATSSGRQFVTEGTALAPLLQDLKRRGVAWIDLTLNPNSTSTLMAARLQVPTVSAQLLMDATLTQEAMRSQLATAVAQAKKDGQATVVFRPYPLSLSVLATFIQSLPEQNVALVPASALLAVPLEKVSADKTTSPTAKP